MRIWDIHPGYLNRQSLLGEHRELHGIVSIIKNNKKGYSNHPETLRWVGYGWALKQRHSLLVSEMYLRGYKHRSPVLLRSNKYQWAKTFIDTPVSQLSIISDKYKGLGAGRIPLPKNIQQLWAQHKYSVMARDISAYKRIGIWVASKRCIRDFHELSLDLVLLLRKPPKINLIRNALLHMWGYVTKYSNKKKNNMNTISVPTLLHRTQELALANNIEYLIHSTALSELGAW